MFGKANEKMKQRIVASASPEQPFCESPPFLSSRRLSVSPWIAIIVAVQGGLMTEAKQLAFMFYSNT